MIKSKKENSILEDSKRNILQIIFSRTMLIMLLIVLQFAYIIARMYAFVEYIPVFLGSELLVVVTMLTVILNSKENPAIKLSWCFLVGIFPIFGSVVYLVVRYDLGYRLQQKRISESEAQSRKYLPVKDEVMEELKEQDMQTYHIADYLNQKAGSVANKNTKVTYFPLGEKQFEEMVKQLESAKEYIFLEYFMIAHGKMWNTILDILIRKAGEGVDVRLLYDGSCSVYLLPYKYPRKLEKLGIKCRMFSPPIPFLSTHYNNRDHRKIMVVDGKVAFTGGVNLCDEYINVNSPCGHWKDVGIMLEGDAVRDFTVMFMQMWIATERKRITELEFPDMSKYLSVQKTPTDAAVTEGIDGYVIPYGDSPVNKENVGEMVYIDILNQAKTYVYIMTPYLILDNEMLTAITFAAKRGVDVRIILPHIPDKKYAFVLAQANYKELLAAGVKVYEYTPGFVHAKIFVSDDERAVVGTVNLDFRSLYWHYECSAYLYRIPVIENIVNDFWDTQEKSERVTLEKIKDIGLLSRMAAYVLKLVAPLM
ncbi:MAG: cardiolipin synthase [Agathobacter sp.]|nr:cardiolipin synthase [Agathobacter sp.]